MTAPRAAAPEVRLSIAPIADLLRRGDGDRRAGSASDVRPFSRATSARERMYQARSATRTLVRLVVADVLGVDPKDVPPEVRQCQHCGGPHGPPRVPGADVALGVARSRDLVVVASIPAPAGSLNAVGVDIEDIPARSTMPPANAILSATEIAGRGSSSRSVRDIDEIELLRIWTRKESVLKATGHGLAVPMSALDLTAPGQPLGLMRWDEERAGRRTPPSPIALRDLAAGDLVPHSAGDVIGAVAVVGARTFALRRSIG